MSIGGMIFIALFVWAIVDTVKRINEGGKDDND
jgi:hypothetical protein